MWIIAKVDKKKVYELKKDFSMKLGKEILFYEPKFIIEKLKKNKVYKIEKNLFGDYLFCYHEKFKSNRSINLLNYTRGLKYFLSGNNSSQKQIVEVVERCKSFEDHKGYIKQSFFHYLNANKLEFLKGPLRSLTFNILEKNKNKLHFLFGKFRATISKDNTLFDTV